MSDYNPERDRLIARLDALPDDCAGLVEAILHRGEVDFGHEILDMFDRATPEDRADHLAFIDSGGPKKIHDLRKRNEDGTPTSGDLARWFK